MTQREVPNQSRRALTPAQAFDMAVALHRQDRLGEAEQLYRAILQLDPNHFGALHYLGMIATQGGRPQEAEQLIRQALALNPDSAEARNNLGIALAALGRLEEARAEYEKAVALHPAHVEARNNLGNTLHTLGRSGDAIAHFEQAPPTGKGTELGASQVGLRPQKAIATEERDVAQLVAVAEQHRRDGRLDLAEHSCRQGLRMQPLNDSALHQLGIIVHDAGKTGEAIDLVRQAIAANGNVGLYHANLCEMCHRSRLLDEAVAAGRRAIALAPDYPHAYNSLGIAYFELEDYDQAVDCYHRAVALDPSFAEAHSNLGNALRALKRFEEAIASHHRAIALKPGYATAHNNLGTALRHVRRFAEAEACYRQALALDPRDPAILNNLALTAAQQRRHDEALELLTRSTALAPGNPETFIVLALLLLERKELDQARIACARALELRPNSADALNVMGRIVFDQGHAQDAVVHYRQAIALKPKLGDAYNNLGNALVELGSIDEAREAFLAALEIDPKSAGALLNFAEMHTFAAGDPYLKLMEDLDQAAETLTEDEQMRLHFALGKAYADLGEYERSFRHLLDGNASKRRLTAYNESAMLGLFDRIRAVFTPELMRGMEGSGDPSPVPVLIVGMPRSGTTLIEQILAAHPRVFGAGELPDMSLTIGSFRDPSGAPIPYPECVGVLTAQSLRQMGAAYVRGLQQRAPTAVRVTDKMPTNFFYLGLVHLMLPQSRIIHVRRDPLDTCLSCFSKLFAGEQPYAYDLAELGRYYRAYEALMEHWRRVLPEGVMLDVQYEELVADFEPQARRLLGYCGLEWDDRCLAFHETQRSVRTASATQVRQPIYGTSVGRWRPYREMLQPLLRELGSG